MRLLLFCYFPICVRSTAIWLLGFHPFLSFYQIIICLSTLDEQYKKLSDELVLVKRRLGPHFMIRSGTETSRDFEVERIKLKKSKAQTTGSFPGLSWRQI